MPFSGRSQWSILAQKYSENVPKMFRTYHVCRPGETYHVCHAHCQRRRARCLGRHGSTLPPARHSDLIVRGRWLVPHHERRTHAIRQALTGSGQQQTGGHSLAPRRPPPRPPVVGVVAGSSSRRWPAVRRSARHSVRVSCVRSASKEPPPDIDNVVPIPGTFEFFEASVSRPGAAPDSAR